MTKSTAFELTIIPKDKYYKDCLCFFTSRCALLRKKCNTQGGCRITRT